jgi:DNA-3-methyladenine glycosylase II
MCRANKLSFESMKALSDQETIDRLSAIHGIGRWSAEYVLLRGLGRLHIFPGDDVGARNNLVRWLNLSGDLDYQSTRFVVDRWKPFGGLVYFHLLLQNLAAAGLVSTRNLNS